MNIAFTGAHGVGKTTVMGIVYDELLKEKLFATTLGSATRDVLGWGRNDRNGNRVSVSPYSSSFQLACVYKRREWMLDSQLSKYDFVLSERWAFDEYIYQGELMSRPLEDGLIQGGEDALNILWEEACWELQNYWDVVYWIPASNRPLSEDGVRPQEKEFQTRIDSLFSNAIENLRETGYTIKVLPNENLEEVRQYLKKEIQEWKK